MNYLNNIENNTNYLYGLPIIRDLYDIEQIPQKLYETSHYPLLTHMRMTYGRTCWEDFVVELDKPTINNILAIYRDCNCYEKMAETLKPGMKVVIVDGDTMTPVTYNGLITGSTFVEVLTYDDAIDTAANWFRDDLIDGRKQTLGGMAIIKADQANNKSAIEAVVNLWMAPIRKEDELARQREEEIEAKNKGRKNNERAEPEPKMLIREVPITISCSRLLKRLKIAKGKTLYSFCAEMDTLVKSNSAGNWSAKYDIYRLAFDRGRWGQDYNSEQAESGMAAVAYNWTILSTPGSLRKCFRGDNVENGLSGRMMLGELPDDPYAKVTVFQDPSKEDIEHIEQAVAILRSCSGFYDTPRLRRAIDAWVEQKRQEAALALDRVKAVYRKRAAVIGFRCGVVFMLLAGKESKTCLEFALTMAEYTLQMQMKNFGPALRNQFVKACEDGARFTINQVIFDELPSNFVFADLRARKGTEYTDAALYSIIHRWTKEGWIVKEGKIFKKVRKS